MRLLKYIYMQHFTIDHWYVLRETVVLARRDFILLSLKGEPSPECILCFTILKGKDIIDLRRFITNA